jgi:hypothetical protein
MRYRLLKSLPTLLPLGQIALMAGSAEHSWKPWKSMPTKWERWSLGIAMAFPQTHFDRFHWLNRSSLTVLLLTMALMAKPAGMSDKNHQNQMSPKWPPLLLFL